VGFFSPKEIEFWPAFRFYPEKIEGSNLIAGIYPQGFRE
jgi:hypothetical protein